MKILILGTAGMLGHQLLMQLGANHETWGTVRGASNQLPNLPGINRSRIIENVNALAIDTISAAISTARPDVVINCIGLIKQREEAKKPLPAIDLNARFPHQVAALCADSGSRMIHISTDCVFSGKKGNYTEADLSDAEDIYGKTKALGEVVQEDHCLTIRTSIIGRELFSRYGLVEWFLGEKGTVKGFQKAIFSGFPTYAIGDFLQEYILPNPNLHGLYHVSADPISKYDLLHLLRDAYNHPLEIIPDDKVMIDRSLNSEVFRAKTGFSPAPWPELIEKMASNSLPYDEWKQ